jgi:TFIIF-interacting CTD phosphatase-like protein
MKKLNKININKMKKQLIVLDLDETLVRTTDIPIHGRSPDFVWNNLYIYKRPFLIYFLIDTTRLYDIAIWSAGAEEYVHTVVNHFIPKNIKLQFVYSKQHCEIVNGIHFRKPLTKLSHLDYENILILDDNGHLTFENNKKCIIPNKYYGCSYDYELLDIATYLNHIHDKNIDHHTNWKNALPLIIENL